MGPAGWMNANLRTTLEKIIARAGLEPWPRLFQNLRASRETELAQTYPVQVVTRWLGNTPAVAMQHYLMTTEDYFEAAVRGTAEAAVNPVGEVVQKAVQQPLATPSDGKQAAWAAHEKTPDLPGFARECDSLQPPRVAGTGFEPATSRL